MKQPNLKLFSSWLTPELTRGLITPFSSRFPDAEMFVVGGAVRDALLGREGKRDLDIVIRGVQGTHLEEFLRTRGRVDYVGRTFGVWKFKPRGGTEVVDIALPRTEKPKRTGGYRDVIVKPDASLDIKDDLARRDFTINAMAWSVRDGKLIDPFRGMNDLSALRIRTVGEPDARFKEDYTRILRALRFAVELDAKIVPKTWSSMKKNAKKLIATRNGVPIVAREMVAKELLKSLASNPVETIRLWDRANVLDVLMPEAIDMKGCKQPKNFHSEGDVWKHTILSLEQLGTARFRKHFSTGWNVESALAVFFHDIGKPPTKQTPKTHGVDRIRFHGHHDVGAQIASDIIDRLALTSYKNSDAGIDVSKERVVFAIRNHLLAIHGDPKTMQATTIEKYFFANPVAADLLLQVMFTDAYATIGENGRAQTGAYRKMMRRIAQVAGEKKDKRRLPPPLLNGKTIMRLLKIKPGPKIGGVLRALREEQLSGKITTATTARKWVKQRYG